jgi:SPP1 family predicted phage head-tail adaptor
MRAGTLRHRVKIQKNNGTAGDYGEQSDNWQTVAEPDGVVWASVSPLSGRELLLAQQVNAEATIRVSMRYWKGLTTDHHILHGTRELAIVSIVDRDDRHRDLELMCREAV